jgi:peptidoglycan hydrolase CwlO-like protein
MSLFDFVTNFQTIIGWFVSGAAIIFMLYMKSQFSTREAHDMLRTDFDAAVSRLHAVEIRMKHMPDETALNALSIQIARLEGDIKSVQPRFERLDALIDRLQNQADRMEDFLKSRS